ncbi:MAG TPA: glucuronate isomerase [Cyclobacteriaceae bacterium]|nr:glucuronate isomerase [Cyclobacteriaceae bacterium]
MKKFLDDSFLLDSDTAGRLYHEHAEKMPIIDYHCHLPPREIAENKKFENLTKIWLEGDHYKWRAMRTNGIDEHFITGKASDYEKFLKWSETVPYTVRNPLYHWTHLELKRYFGIDRILNPESAREIYHKCTERLQQEDFSARNILKKFNVEVVCTTDDPADQLENHEMLNAEGFAVRILPTFRPDKSMQVENPTVYNEYLDRLARAADSEITDLPSLYDVLKKRHDFFESLGCRLSDHGIEEVYSEEIMDKEAEEIFGRIRKGTPLTNEEQLKFKSAMLLFFAELDYDSGWTQQYHIGALRNNNSRMLEALGPDSGFDSIGDANIGQSLSRFLDSLDRKNILAKTILYNVNPRDNYLVGSMAGNFNEGSFPGKIQFGAGWWFLDQKEGMEWQINALSNLGLLSRFVGMTTDSRSFLSYTRHEYFRRILCNLVGMDVEKGLIPNDFTLLGKMIEDICYFNARKYFAF